jgi:hypothetical protein
MARGIVVVLLTVHQPMPPSPTGKPISHWYSGSLPVGCCVELVFGIFLRSWLGIPIFGFDSWGTHWKQNSDSIFDSGDSGWIFFLIPMSGKSENWNSDLQNSKFLFFVCAGTHYVSLPLISIDSKACTIIQS